MEEVRYFDEDTGKMEVYDPNKIVQMDIGPDNTTFMVTNRMLDFIRRHKEVPAVITPLGKMISQGFPDGSAVVYLYSFYTGMPVLRFIRNPYGRYIYTSYIVDERDMSLLAIDQFDKGGIEYHDKIFFKSYDQYIRTHG